MLTRACFTSKQTLTSHVLMFVNVDQLLCVKIVEIVRTAGDEGRCNAQPNCRIFQGTVRKHVSRKDL